VNLVTLTAAVQLQSAKADGVRRVVIEAYGGGVATGVSGARGPVIADLAGMEIPSPVPLLAEHSNSLSTIVGHGRAEMDGKKLVIRGEISAPNDAARNVLALLDSGTPLQASMGWEIFEMKSVRKGETVTANGRTFTAGAAGLEVTTKSRLREVSIVALGADPTTSVLRAALSAKGRSMTTLEAYAESLGTTVTDANRAPLTAAFHSAFPNAEPAATADELRDSLGRDGAPLMARAMTEGWSVTRARKESLSFFKASLSNGPTAFNPHGGYPGGAAQGKPSDLLAASLMVRAGLESAAEKSFGAGVLESSRPMHRASFVDLCAHALRLDGHDVPHSRNELIRQAVSTGSLPVALGSSADKILENQWRETMPTWRSFAAIRSAPNFREQTGLRPTFAGDLLEIAPGGAFKHGSFSESTFKWTVKTFGKMYTIDRTQIVNDDLGVFSELIPGLGKAALRTLSDLVYQTILTNDGSFFSVGNGNTQTGGASALSAASLTTAVKQMRIQKDPDGNNLDLAPAVLVVSPELEVTARQILNSQTVSRVATGDNLPTGNPFSGLAALEVEPRLSNSTFTGYSATQWYLFASPLDVPVVVAFLDGRQSPIVESFGFDADPSTLAATFRVFHDFGASLADYRAAQKSAGA
jgi:hypothetical protein